MLLRSGATCDTQGEYDWGLAALIAVDLALDILSNSLGHGINTAATRFVAEERCARHESGFRARVRMLT